MFAEPLSLTVNAVAKSLVRVGSNATNTVREGIFEDHANGFRLKVTHLLGKRNRRTVRFDVSKIAADPLLAGVNREASSSYQFVIDSPTAGFSDVELGQNAQALVDWLDVPANLAKVVAGES